jgi:N-hydroxyarylamine O-acetyltransferase
MSPDEAAAYLERIGIPGPVAPTLETLTELQAAHLVTVPFENLDIHLGVPIVVAEPALYDKIVRRRRGGFCYELNGLFAALLRQLGYRVTLLAARVHGPRGLGPPYDHLALRVDLDEPWLVDVGFGRFSRRPLRLDSRAEQSDPHGTFGVQDADHGDLDVAHGGKPEYRLEARPRELADFAATCWYQQTSPASHFTRSLVCTLGTVDGQVTLAGRKLIETAGEARAERELDNGGEVLDIYRTVFGIELDREPVVRADGNGQ